MIVKFINLTEKYFFMIPQYNSSRRCYICYINKAQKDNKIVKKGESYIWVRKTEFAPKEYFRNEKELDKIYPKYYNVTKSEILTLLRSFKQEVIKNNKISCEKYLNSIIK